MANLTPENVGRVKDMYGERYTIAQIERDTGISRYYVNKILAGEEIPLDGRPKAKGWNVYYEKLAKMRQKNVGNTSPPASPDTEKVLVLKVLG